MKINRILSFAIALLTALTSTAATSTKLFSKAAEKVWNMDYPEFNHRTVIPEEVSNNQSAVIIASLFSIEADFQQGVNYSKAVATGKMNSSTTDAVIVRRTMVKILDAAGVERFSEVSFGESDKMVIDTYQVMKTEEAFGARIYKPDGTMVNVDVSEALAITSGKKGKETEEYKLAIPGLEPGDVLDYFIYEHCTVDELSLPIYQVPLLSRYPTMTKRVHGEFSPLLTVEVRSYNGAPPPEKSGISGRNFINMKATNLPFASTDSYTATNRQNPMYRIAVKNNASTLLYVPTTARKGGVYVNLPGPTNLADAREYLKDLKIDGRLTGNIVKLTKNWIAANPESTAEQRREVALLAANYLNITDEREDHSGAWMAKSYLDALTKLKIAPDSMGIGLITSRETVPVNQIISIDDPSIVIYLDGKLYMGENELELYPGEFDGPYQGEEALVYIGKPSEYTGGTLPVRVVAPVTRNNANTLNMQVDVAFDPADLQTLNVTRDVTAMGQMRRDSPIPSTLGEWAAKVEDFLGIPQKNRYSDPDIAKEKFRKFADEKMEKECEQYLGVKAKEIKSYHIEPDAPIPGTTPSSHYTMECTVDGLVTETGDEILLNVGRLFGRNIKIKDSDRVRTCDALTGVPRTYRISTTITPPEGYKFDEESVAALNSSHATTVGVYFTQATVDDDNRLNVSVVEKYYGYVVPLEKWSEYLEVTDAAAHFNDAEVVLVKTAAE